MSSTRYRLTELTPSGYGRRIWAERLSTVTDLIVALGGRWRVERQYHDARSGQWRRDGGREPVWEQGVQE